VNESVKIAVMPIYEYRCSNCHRKVSIFWRSMSAVDESKATCIHCNSQQLTRLVSRVRVIRGGDSKSGSETPSPSASGMDDAMMGELGGLDENNPRELGHFMRKMAGESGEDMGPEFNEIIGRLEKGEDPEKIEQSMGDIFGGTGAGDMMDDDMSPPPPVSPAESETPEGPVKTEGQKKERRAVRAKPLKPTASARKPKKTRKS
jgi:putative FmdB family regulatory protein